MVAMDSAGSIPDQARILIVDDHPIVRQGLKQLINRHADLAVCAEAASAREALEAIRASKPDAAVVDLKLPDAHGIEVIQKIRALHPDLALLALSMSDENLYAERALGAGANGYIMKSKATEEVIGALRHVLSGEIYLSEEMLPGVVRRFARGVPPVAGPPISRLTNRELQVFELIGRGKTTRETANALHISVKAIETHQAHIKEKLGLKNMAELRRYTADWLANEGKS